MKKAKIIFFLLFLFPIALFAQKIELNRVTKAELQEARHKTDTSAPAAFIFKKAQIKFFYNDEEGFSSTTTFQVKLKIYKKEGLKWANFKIPYYTGYENLEDESVDLVSGYTYNLENDKVIKTKVTGESKFKQQINENWGAKSITFPNVKEGSIIELEYKFKSQNISILPEFQYQYEIPVDYAELNTNIPEIYIYNAIRRGYVEMDITQKLESTTQSFESSVQYSKVGRTLTIRELITKYVASNIPALKDEEFVNNINNYYGKIEHELKLIRYVDKEPKQIATTWEAVAKSIYEDKDFSSGIKDFEYYKTDVMSIINSTTNQEELVRKIFDFVKGRMNWNGRYGYYPKRKMQVAYTEKVGNVAEINLMLVSMLRMAGIDANPVLGSTRENGFASFPNHTLFNYVIATATVEGNTFLMDATDKVADLNRLPVRALNWEGRMIKNDGTSLEVNLMPKTNSMHNTGIMAEINPQGEVAGKIREQYFDYNALIFREKYNGVSKESYIEKLEKESEGLEISDYDVQNNLDLNLPIVENYNFKSTNSSDVIGDKIYVSPFLFFTLSVNPFKQEKREFPVDFIFPNQNKFNINLTIPQGYAIETLPSPKAVALPDALGNFKYNISSNGNQIQILYTRDINQAVIGPEYYEALKNFFREIVTKQTEKIVLKKV